jgi:hypothetical protein
MSDNIVGFLGSLSSTVFRLAAICFILVNGAAIAAFALSRSRRLIDTWTPRIVTIDAVLLGAGLGVPLLAGATKLGVKMLAGMSGGVAALFK